VLVASPCVAPFMASAVGFALTGNASAFECVAIISSVGLGMAIPYICFAMFPSLLKKLPRPGRWLELLKKILSVPMFLTVLWLAWVAKQQNSDFIRIFLILASLTVVAVIWRRFVNPFQSLKKRAVAMVCCVAILLLVFWGYPNSQKQHQPPQSENCWTTDKVKEFQKQGYCVFVDFTASWCLTCQYNKQILYSKQIKELFEKQIIKDEIDIITITNDFMTQQCDSVDELLDIWADKKVKDYEIDYDSDEGMVYLTIYCE
jgi:thiol:disulfide interchange protein DsbD